MSTEKCQRCGEEGQDRRTLWMKCFYAMEEFHVPFKLVSIHGQVVEQTGWEDPLISPTSQQEAGLSTGVFGLQTRTWAKPDPKIENRRFQFYTLRVCKECRADWLQVIEAWFNSPPEIIPVYDEVKIERNIPVRIAGAVRMMSWEEYEEYQEKRLTGTPDNDRM